MFNVCVCRFHGSNVQLSFKCIVAGTPKQQRCFTPQELKVKLLEYIVIANICVEEL